MGHESVVSWRFDSRLGLNADLSPATGLTHGLGHSPSLSRNLEGRAMGLVAPCLSFPTCTKGSVGRKAGVGASPFPAAPPKIHPGHLNACGAASVGSKDGADPTSRSAGRDGTASQMPPFSIKLCEGVSPSPCAEPHTEQAVRGGPCASPPIPPSLVCVASHCPGGPRQNPLEGAGRSITKRCHRTPPTPPCRAVPPRRAVPQSPSRTPTPTLRELGKSGRGRWLSFSSGRARPELSHCRADLLFPGRIMSVTAARSATEVGKKKKKSTGSPQISLFPLIPPF